MNAASGTNSKMWVGSARATHEPQLTLSRVASGSTAYTSTDVVELVRNSATTWPKPIRTAIARPMAALL